MFSISETIIFFSIGKNTNYMLSDKEYLLKIMKTRMPFGKYKDMLLIDLPEWYIVWFANSGFPEGELGNMLKCVYEIKLNGLEYLFKPLR